jgi:1,4-alpha-glucan branching enzyme
MRKLFTKMLGMMMLGGFILFNTAFAQTVQVTFRVDMSEVDEISPLGVHIAGSFQGWNPSSTEMNEPPFGKVFTYTAELNPGDEILYKYINGNDWPGQESVPAGCGQPDGYGGFNRYLTVPNENVVLDIICFGGCTICNPEQVDITFQVDMSNQTVTTGVFLAGTFQGWNSTATPMTNIGNDIYAVTVTLGEGEIHEYKFINSGNWEIVPPNCALNQNRYIEVPGISTTLNAPCFGSCDPCGGPSVDVEITFKVDMSQEEISPAGVHIAGGFQGWDPGATLMTDEGGGIYSHTAVFPSGTYQEYKFINGNDWPFAENLPPECSNSNNRYFTVPDVDTELDLVCYGLCGPCPLPAEVEITFQVDMNEQTVSGDGVHLIGTFNNFDPTATPMSLQRNGVYEATITLTEGDLHEYKFVNGNTLAGEETVPVECADANGYRELTVPADTTTLDVVCFGSCEPCVPPPTVDVTFQVDMSNEEVSQEGVFIVGSFQGWTLAADEMTLTENSVYTFTTSLVVGEDIEFKYVNGITWDDAELISGGCTSNDGNRMLTVPDVNTTLDLVCFASCTECIIPVDVNVTFRVDMSFEDVSADGVHVAGSFNGFDPTATEMVPEGDGTYTATVLLTAGHVTYKFINGNTFAGEEIVPAECGEDNGLGGYNRFIDVTTDTIIDVVCFSSCEACPEPVEVEVTFQVDMREQTVAPEGVHIAGTFNFFSTTETPLTDMGDDIWAVTLTLTQGDFIMYKFINGNTFQGFETVPPECSQEDGNRTLIVPGEELTLDPVCFGSCDLCVPPPTVEVTFQVDMSNEEVSQEGVFIVGSFQGWTLAADEMTLTENNIYTYTTSLVVGDDHEFKYVNGITWDDAELISGDCTSNDGNRMLTVPDVNTTLDLVCFGTCEICVIPVDVEVTFQVDMTNEVVSAEGVYLAGSFNGFNPADIQLTHMGGGIYSTTLTLSSGDHVTYKYTNGPSFDFVEIVPAECGEDDGFGGYNRYVDVPEVDYVIPLHCFSSCDVCTNLTHEITLFEGWNSLSSHLMPASTDINDVMDPIANELIILQTMTEVLFPDGNLNTIQTWDSQSAYKIKVSADVVLTITGTPEQNKTLQLEEGWNLMPVISAVPVNAEALFGDVIEHVIVVKGIAEIGILWPEYDINTLGTLMPGKAYFVKTSQAIEVTFP